MAFISRARSAKDFPKDGGVTTAVRVGPVKYFPAGAGTTTVVGAKFAAIFPQALERLSPG